MMNYKNEPMDEEKSFEVIQEGAQKQFDHPTLVKRGLTEVSAMFDRNGKGYLDETERALRRMDSTDKGFLGIDKVCVIFESLQSEQERSSQLLEALRTESKKSLNLKKGVIALSFFAILLALANIGTSFAVAKLVKDTSVSGGDLLDAATGVRVATTSKVASFEMQSIDEGRRRRLQAQVPLDTLGCATEVEIEFPSGKTKKQCALQGTVTKSVADALHAQLVATDSVVLTCNQNKTQIMGTFFLPSGGPGLFQMAETDYDIYPTNSSTDEKYTAHQKIWTPPNETRAEGYHCDPTTEFALGIYCPRDSASFPTDECLVISAFQPVDNCWGQPIVCGPKPATQPPSTIVV